MSFLKGIIQTATSSGGIEGTQLNINGNFVTVNEKIAEGGYGFVYRCTDSSGKTYALKVLQAPDQEHYQATINEFEIQKRCCNHPNIVAVYGMNSNPSTHQANILMEFCSDDLIKHINSVFHSGFDDRTIVDVFVQVCEAVNHMHSLNPPVIHRDLKPENVLRNNGKWKLCDFGSATTHIYNLETERTVAEDDIQKNTTALYRAPEMCDLYRSETIGPKADVWALGCVLFKLCTFKDAFDEANNLQILNVKYHWPQNRNVNPKFKEIVRYIFNSDPEQRPTARDVLGELQRQFPDLVDPKWKSTHNNQPQPQQPQQPQQQMNNDLPRHNSQGNNFSIFEQRNQFQTAGKQTAFNQPNSNPFNQPNSNPFNQPSTSFSQPNSANPFNQPSTSLSQPNSANPFNQPSTSFSQPNSANPFNQNMNSNPFNSSPSIPNDPFAQTQPPPNIHINPNEADPFAAAIKQAHQNDVLIDVKITSEPKKTELAKQPSNNSTPKSNNEEIEDYSKATRFHPSRIEQDPIQFIKGCLTLDQFELGAVLYSVNATYPKTDFFLKLVHLSGTQAPRVVEALPDAIPPMGNVLASRKRFHAQFPQFEGNFALTTFLKENKANPVPIGQPPICVDAVKSLLNHLDVVITLLRASPITTVAEEAFYCYQVTAFLLAKLKQYKIKEGYTVELAIPQFQNTYTQYKKAFSFVKPPMNFPQEPFNFNDETFLKRIRPPASKTL